MDQEVYHIVPASEFKVSENNEVTSPSLESEGFIHLCFLGQVEGVIERYYSNIKELVVVKLSVADLYNA